MFNFFKNKKKPKPFTMKEAMVELGEYAHSLNESFFQVSVEVTQLNDGKFTSSFRAYINPGRYGRGETFDKAMIALREYVGNAPKEYTPPEQIIF